MKEAQVKKELMQLEFELNSRLQKTKEGESVKSFESSGNDIVTGEAGIDKF